MTLLFDQYDLKDDTTLMNDIADKILQLPWFDNAGTVNKEIETKVEQFLDELSVNQYEIQWISKNELTDQLNSMSFEDSAVWSALKDIPTIYMEEIQQKEMEEAWKILLNDLPEHLFHVVFEKAYTLYQGEEEVRYLINNAFYVSTLIVLAELVGEKAFANKLSEIIETGNIVVGFEGEKLYLL